MMFLLGKMDALRFPVYSLGTENGLLLAYAREYIEELCALRSQMLTRLGVPRKEQSK